MMIGLPRRAITTWPVTVGVDGRDAEGALQALDGLQQRLFQVAVIIFLDQVGDHFAVGLRLEDVLLGEQLFLQVQVVLDDAVVHDGDLPLSSRNAGWAFSSEGRPWVAQRVWAMP